MVILDSSPDRQYIFEVNMHKQIRQFKTLFLWFVFAILTLNEPCVCIPEANLGITNESSLTGNTGLDGSYRTKYLSPKSEYGRVIGIKNDNGSVKSISRKTDDYSGGQTSRFTRCSVFGTAFFSIDSYIRDTELSSDFSGTRQAETLISYIHCSDGKK